MAVSRRDTLTFLAGFVAATAAIGLATNPVTAEDEYYPAATMDMKEYGQWEQLVKKDGSEDGVSKLTLTSKGLEWHLAKNPGTPQSEISLNRVFREEDSVLVVENILVKHKDIRNLRASREVLDTWAQRFPDVDRGATNVFVAEWSGYKIRRAGLNENIEDRPDL